MFILSIAIASSSSFSSAITPTWNDGASGTWATNTNWNTPATAPGSTTLTTNTDTAQFSNTLGSAAITVDSNRNLKLITFQSSGIQNTTLTGGSLLLTTGASSGSSISDSSTGTQAINSSIVLENNGSTGFGSSTFTSGTTGFTSTSLAIGGDITSVATSGNTTALTIAGLSTTTGNVISGAISDGSAGGKLSLTKSGVGQWILTGNNSFSGGISTTGGILTIEDSDVNGTSGQNVNVTKNGLGNSAVTSLGSTLQILANGFGDGSSQVITYGNDITVTGSNAAFFVDEVTPGGLSKNKTIALGNLNLAASKLLTVSAGDGYILSFTGATTLDGGAQFTPAAGASVILNTVTLDSAATTGTTSTLQLNGAGTGLITGAISNNASDNTKVLAITVNGSGTWTLSGVNTYTGATAITSGTLDITGSGTLGTGSALGMGGGTLDLGGASLTVGAVSISAAAASGNTIQNGSLTGTSYAASNTSGNAIVTANLLINGSAGLTKSGAGTLTLAGANTYTGATAVNSGTLALANGSSLGATAVTVGNNATLQVNGSSSIGTTAAGSLSIRPTSNSNTSTLNMADGTIGTLTLNNTTSTLSGSVLTVGSNNASSTRLAAIDMDLGATSDKIVVNNTTANTVLFTNNNSTANVASFNITGLGNLSGTTQVLVSAGGAIQYANLIVPVLGTTSGNFSGYTVALNTTNNVTQIQLTETANAALTAGNYYWSGAAAAVPSQNGTTAWNSFVNGNSNTSNFAQGSAGGTNANNLLNSNNNVYFDSTGVTAALNTTLGQNLTINSLNFTTSKAVSVGGNTLTVQAGTAGGNTSGNGVTVSGSAVSDLISSNVVLGNNQTWTVNSGDTLTASGVISGGANTLTKAGTGTLALTGSAANTNTGLTSVNAGELDLNDSGGVAVAGNLTIGTGTGTASTVKINTSSASNQIATSSIVTVNRDGTLTGTGATTSALTLSTGKLTGNGTVSNTSVNIQNGASLVSGSPSQVSGTHLTTVGGLTVSNTAITVGSGFSSGTATLTFDLAADNPGNTGINGGNAGYHSFANANQNTTYLSLTGSSSINFAGTTAVSLVDLTNGNLSLRVQTPYLLINAGSDANYLNLVINSGTDTNPILSLSQNDTTASGYVLGVWAGGTNPLTDYTAIAINQFGSDGTPLGSAAYFAPVLYLDAGQLEVVPEPSTWVLLIGGLALMVVIQRRKNKQS